MTHSLQITRFGGPEVLKLVETPSLKPGNGQVKIKVAAAGVNFADVVMRMGNYPEAPKPPFVPGYEISGVVEETGPSVQGFKVGDRVVGACRFGGYTSGLILPERQIRKIPKRLSDIEAAAIPVNFMTAWLALHDMARVRKGDRVLVQSAAGGVGVAAVQIAALAGAEVVGLVGSEKKFQAVKSLGAKEVLTHAQWEALPESESGGFQVILDSTGGKSLKRSFKSLARGGRVVNFGASSMISGEKRSLPQLFSFLINMPLYTPIRLMMENKGVFGLNMLPLFEDPLLTQALDQVIQHFDEGKLQVLIGKTFPLAQGGEAHSYLQGRSNIGKIILTP